jgi:hypothetical protein
MDIKPNLQTSEVRYAVATVTALTSVFQLAGDDSTNIPNWKRKERKEKNRGKVCTVNRN